jgi:signal transduction histidine kinase
MLFEKTIRDQAPSGLAAMPALQWGSHVGQIFDSADELRETLVPYFKAGLENNERCLWVTAEPLPADAARAAMRIAMPDFDAREKNGQIEIHDIDSFYARGEDLQPAKLVDGILERERRAVAAGYKGLRTNGNCSWVEENQRADFLDYELRVQKAVRGRKLLCMCSFHSEPQGGPQLRDVLKHHDLVLQQPRFDEAHSASGRNDQSPDTARTTEPTEFLGDIAAIEAIAAVPTILRVVSDVTGMGFSAIARVTPGRWVCLAVDDRIGFGLKPGGELKVESTLCHEVRQARDVVVIDHVAEDATYRDHHTPATYGLQSYISMPIFLHDGSFYGTLCAIDPKPAKLNNPTVLGMFRMFADLIAFHLEAGSRVAKAEAGLSDAQAINDLRDQFIAVLGHDLRNSIAAIAGGAGLLRRAPLDERSRFISESIAKSADSMASLVENIMDLARSQLGQSIILHKSREGLGPALLHVVEELRLAYPGREIRTRIAIERPMEADPRHVARLLSNLLRNALTYGAEDEPVDVIATTDDDAFVLSVGNKGAPIPEDAQRRLFSPFTRGAIRPDQQGLGLGLFIVSEIAQAHGGTMSVTSTPAETRFTFRMPLG